MRSTHLACVLILMTALAAPEVRAGIADSPLPVLSVGVDTLHLYSIPGAINGTGLGTYFACTSTDTAPIQVGVEVFPSPGGPPCNDAAATSLNVAPGATVIFGTTPAVGISVSSTLGGCSFSKGSGRILATSKKLVCTTFLADVGNAPPASMVQLTIIKKTTQKAAN